jgi:hypothetical protein
MYVVLFSAWALCKYNILHLNPGIEVNPELADSASGKLILNIFLNFKEFVQMM